MSQALAAIGLGESPREGGASGLSASEKSATSPTSTQAPPASTTTTSAPAPAPKPRSCVLCRTRKVRCDKQSPCSTCRRAKIACVFPSTDRPPRWARRLERLTSKAATANGTEPQLADPGAGKVMDRLRNLENLVKELSGQLEQAHASATSPGRGSSEGNSPGNPARYGNGETEEATSSTMASTINVQKQFGRMVVQDASHTRYVSSGFWSRVNDELNGLKMDTRDLAGYDSDTSDEGTTSAKTPSTTQELERSPAERHSFLFRHNLNPAVPDLHEFQPLPSQIPFLLDVFSENVNFVIQCVHMPTINKMVRNSRGNAMPLTPANEALMFSIYYAAITSMEDDDVMTNFGSSKADLSLKYRLGLEHALAMADFLNAPDIVLVQAFALFLALVRRHDSPRYVWMMTGLVIRMAQYLGLQRDGSHFTHLSPFEIEMRRRLWWGVCMLDMRASEDQGTELTITSNSFDTKIPLNINEADISPETKEMPQERDGITDMTFARIQFRIGEIMEQMMTLSVKKGVAGLEEQSRLLNEIYQQFEKGYCQFSTESGNIAYWVAVTIARLVMAKMTLIIFLPSLFSSPNEHLSDEVKNKLLVSAIEVAEYNHALNAEQACRQWRWVYQTYTHWHAIVYLMIETSRRPWSPIIERAWVALHSNWLMPSQSPIAKNLRIWVPLRKMMHKASQHRDGELHRLQTDPQAAAHLELEDQNFPVPSSSAPFATSSTNTVEIFRDRWRQLISLPETPANPIPASVDSNAIAPPLTIETENPPIFTSNDTPPFEPTYLNTNTPQQISQHSPSTYLPTPLPSHDQASAQTPYNPLLSLPQLSYPSSATTPAFGTLPWLWADGDPSSSSAAAGNGGGAFQTGLSGINDGASDGNLCDVNMELEGGGGDMDWYSWIELAKGMEWEGGEGGGGGAASGGAGVGGVGGGM